MAQAVDHWSKRPNKPYRYRNRGPFNGPGAQWRDGPESGGGECRHRYRSRSDKPDIGAKEEMSQDHLDHLSHGPNGPNSNESLE